MNDSSRALSVSGWQKTRIGIRRVLGRGAAQVGWPRWGGKVGFTPGCDMTATLSRFQGERYNAQPRVMSDATYWARSGNVCSRQELGQQSKVACDRFMES